MALPIASNQGFLRTPSKYPHDAFAVDTGGRVRPHSGFDATPTVANAIGRSVLGGRVTRADFTIYAGNYVEILEDDGWIWLYLHFARRLVRPGAVVGEGGQIGIVGNTGGGGGSPLKGNPKMGRHLHISRCRNQTAADRIINGLVRERYRGESNIAWATAHGLSDPYPHILASLKTKPQPKPSPPKKTARQIEEEELMGVLDDVEALIKEHAEITQSRLRADLRGYFTLDMDDSPSTKKEDWDRARHCVYIGQGEIEVCEPPAVYGAGQIRSHASGKGGEGSDYRRVDQTRPVNAMTTNKFINKVKDTLTGLNYFGDDRRVTVQEAWAWIDKHEKLIAEQKQ